MRLSIALKRASAASNRLTPSRQRRFRASCAAVRAICSRRCRREPDPSCCACCARRWMDQDGGGSICLSARRSRVFDEQAGSRNQGGAPPILWCVWCPRGCRSVERVWIRPRRIDWILLDRGIGQQQPGRRTQKTGVSDRFDSATVASTWPLRLPGNGLESTPAAPKRPKQARQGRFVRP